MAVKQIGALREKNKVLQARVKELLLINQHQTEEMKALIKSTPNIGKIIRELKKLKIRKKLKVVK